MKNLLFNGESYEAEKIIKTNTSIIGYNGDTEVFAFRGISDFSLFELQDGEYDVDRMEQLESENALLALELIDTQIRLEQSEQEQAALLLELIDKGVL